MFSITCRTCAAKLKVKNTAAIGQRLACPKCGEMVEVQPPPGWTPPEESEVSQSAAGEQSFAAGDFEDIEQLIGGRSPAAPKPAQSKQKTTQPTVAPPGSGGPVTKSQTSTVPGDPSRAVEKNASGKTQHDRPPGELPPASIPPIGVPEKPLLQPRSDKFDLTQPREYLPDSSLPPPDWTKPDNSKARTILISSLLLIGFIGVIAAIISLLNRSDSVNDGKQLAQAKTEEPFAEQPSGQDPSPESPLSPEVPRPDAKQTEPSAIGKEQEPRPADSGKANTNESGNLSEALTPDPSAASSNAEKSGSKGELANAEQMPQDKSANSSSVPLPSREERPVSPLASDAPTAGNPPEASTSKTTGAADVPDPTGPTTLTDRLGKLSQLLSGPGTSLTELGDLAQSERTDRLVGLPRYLISQPTPEPPIGDPWTVPIAEIVYKEVPLHLFVSEFSALVGVPMSIDALALGQSGIPLDAPVTVELENTSTGEILATVLQKLKLERVNLAGVEVILPAGSQVMGEYRFPLPKLKDPSPEKFQAMCESLMKLVDPVSWTLDTGKRKLTVAGEELVATNTSTASAQVREFLEKLNSATRLLVDQADAAAAEELRSRAMRSQVGLQKALQLEPTLDQKLEEFLQRVYIQTGVAISVDWAALSAAGWSNLSEVPGDFQAETVEKLLQELSRSLSATWIAIDERTFQLTSFQEASRRGMLEVYPLQGLAIEPGPLMEILNQTLGGQLRENPAVQFLYVPEINGLVVSAPQPLQRQFEAIVNRLKQAKK